MSSGAGSAQHVHRQDPAVPGTCEQVPDRGPPEITGVSAQPGVSPRTCICGDNPTEPCSGCLQEQSGVDL